MRVSPAFRALLMFLLIGLAFITTEANAKRLSCEDGYICFRARSGQTWQTLFPDERERAIVMRINHRNGQLYPGFKIKVPERLQETGLLDYSPFPQQIEAPQEKVIVVDLNKEAWGAYDDSGTLVRWGPATGGRDICPDSDDSCRTKPGDYRVYSLGSSDCVSSKFPVPDGGAPMPYCMFFNGGQALHGSPGGVIRANVSHGCVRMFVQDAEWLRYDFVDPPMAENDYRGTRVVILPYGEEDDQG